MVEFSEKSDLPQDAFGVDEIIEGFRDLLDRDLLPVLGVEGGYYHAIRAEAYRLD